MQGSWEWYHTVGLLGIIVAIALFGLLIPATQVLLAWLLTLAALLLFAMLAGHGITGDFWLGWLSNEQNRVSLSRLQMFLWTVVVLSAFLNAALVNIRAGHLNSALDIAIPEEIWIAMGISTTSLVGSPLILSLKKRKKTNKPELKRTLVLLGKMEEAEDLTAEMVDRHASGSLDRNRAPGESKLSDLIRGEEVGNAHTLDLTRLQNLFFTLILIGAYAANLGTLLVAEAVKISTSPISAFPPLDASSVALLGISHAGYLVSKTIDKQPEGE